MWCMLAFLEVPHHLAEHFIRPRLADALLEIASEEVKDRIARDWRTSEPRVEILAGVM